MDKLTVNEDQSKNIKHVYTYFEEIAFRFYNTKNLKHTSNCTIQKK